MKKEVIDQEVYICKGRAARRDGLSRKSNPYNLRSLKGHLWDDGWSAQGKRFVKYSPTPKKGFSLNLRVDHSNDDLNLPHTY